MAGGFRDKRDFTLPLFLSTSHVSQMFVTQRLPVSDFLEIGKKNQSWWAAAVKVSIGGGRLQIPHRF